MKQTIKILRFLPVLFLSACNHMPPDANILEGDKHHWSTIHSKEKEYYQEKAQYRSRLAPLLVASSKIQADWQPQIGLALSGGGQRAASVSIGFLESLYRYGILDKVDVISSVSGGSYAAYWWYTKHYWAGRKNKAGQDELYRVDDKNGRLPELFRRFNMYTVTDPKAEEILCLNKTEFDDIPRCRPGDTPEKSGPQNTYEQFPFFYHNFNNGYLINRSQKAKWLRYSEIAGKFLGFLPTIPVHWLANGVFDMKLNLNPFQTYYRNGLERDYGLYPNKCDKKDEKAECIPLESYANATDFIFPRTGATDPDAEALLDTMKTQHLPFWVINATAAYGTKPIPKLFRGEWSGYSNYLRHTAYEFTPLYQGSPWWSCSQSDIGCEADPIKLSRQVAISGAAIDSFRESWKNILIDVFNANLGQYIDNPKVSDSSRFIHRLIPSALAWLHHGAHDTDAPFIYLSDGGHSDNLGLYSLVRRGVKKIIVLDAEHEKHNGYQTYASFESLQSTRIHLWKEHNLLVDLPDIFHDHSIKDEPITAETLQFDYLKYSSPIFKGFICKAKPGQIHCPKDDSENQELLYVKLAIDKSKFPDPKDKQWIKKSPFDSCLTKGQIGEDKNPYSCLTLKYGWDQFSGDDSFPHNSTEDIFYSPAQYSGYVSLGADLGRQLIEEWSHPERNKTYVEIQDKDIQL
ncbi:patatin-like phospholipase family protein [Methylobacter sp. YRD-M1]|uniref:patatin-like phospholipase family protein n=1 Tax=Methylobacter sp. YRD-M1 TaxID=2911520 RepID=UPI00227C4FB7|nr:patatin-like phospholipase family protein [Methylobacter sp. YRD-M1]WAK00757.1 patatin-like phospholipase family protein [Methylobacter sp. YRD-M1]